MYYYHIAVNDTATPSDLSVRCRPDSNPAIPLGCGPWFPVAFMGRYLVFGSQCTSNSEAKKTMSKTGVFCWDTWTNTLTFVAIPTTLGFFTPPNSDGVTFGSSTDDVCVTTIDGTEYVMACLPSDYGGWEIATWGRIPVIAAFTVVDGELVYVPEYSYTADDLAASSAAGAEAYPFAALRNAYSERYRASLGPVGMKVMPVSGHLALVDYFYRQLSVASCTLNGTIDVSASTFLGVTPGMVVTGTGVAAGTNVVSVAGKALVLSEATIGSGVETLVFTHSAGSLVAVEAGTGTVAGWYEMPLCTRTDGTPVSPSLRNICVHPTLDQALVTCDAFLQPSGNAGNAVLLFGYDGAGNFAPLSSPVDPPQHPAGKVNAAAFHRTYNLPAFFDLEDGEAGVFLPVSGGNGLAVFASHELAMFAFDEHGHLPTFEAGGPEANWWLNWPSAVAGVSNTAANNPMPDFAFGSYATGVSGFGSGGLVKCIVWDSVGQRVILIGVGGQISQLTPATPLELGTDIITNSGFGGNTAGWSGFLGTSSVTRVPAPNANPPFVSEFVAELTQLNGSGRNILSWPQSDVVAGQNYLVVCSFLASGAPRPCAVVVFFHDLDGNQVAAINSDTWINSTTGVVTTVSYVWAPPGAVTAVANATVLDSLIGETVYAGDMHWWPVPGTSVPPNVLNQTHLANGVQLQINKGDILVIDGEPHLLMPVMTIDATPMLPLRGIVVDLNLSKI
jgi:hypothetical protein